MELHVALLSGEVFAKLKEAQPGWRLPELLAQLPKAPQQRRSVWLGGKELAGELSLADLGASDGATLSLVLSRRRCVLTAQRLHAHLFCADTGACLLSFQGHRQPVHSALFSESRECVLTRANDCVRLWCANTGACLRVCDTLGGGSLVSASFAEGERMIFTATKDGCLAFWTREAKDDTDVVPARSSWLPHGRISSAMLSPCGKSVLSLGNSYAGAELWSLGEQFEEAFLWLPGASTAVFSPQGDFILGSGTSGYAVLRSTREDQELELGRRTDDDDNLVAGAFSQDGRLFATISYDSGLTLWSIEGQKLWMADAGVEPRSAAFSPDGQRLLLLGDDAVLFSVATGRELLTLAAGAEIRHAGFSPEGDRIVTGSEQDQVEVWCAEGKQRFCGFRTPRLASVVLSF